MKIPREITSHFFSPALTRRTSFQQRTPLSPLRGCPTASTRPRSGATTPSRLRRTSRVTASPKAPTSSSGLRAAEAQPPCPHPLRPQLRLLRPSGRSARRRPSSYKRRRRWRSCNSSNNNSSSSSRIWPRGARRPRFSVPEIKRRR